MSIMPGAVWRPISVPGGLSRRTPGRAIILHVAASEAASLFGFFNGNGSANSHFYVAKNGTIEQYVDTAYQSWASMAANKNTISVETQGGVTNPDGEPWTAAQVASLARICAWAHAEEGIPLTIMPNSKPASRGIGYHRLGIKPWVVADGELWSSSTGKLCPGAAKIAQIPAVIAAAAGGDDMAQVPQDQWNSMVAAVEQIQMVIADPTSGIRQLLLGYGARIERIDEGAHGGWGYGQRIEDVEARVVALQAALDAVVTAGTTGLSKDDLKSAIAEALKENVVHVDVDVQGGNAA